MLIKDFRPSLGLMESIGQQNGAGGVVDERLRRGMEIARNMKTLVQTDL
jgi:hypothetical protein